MFSFVIVAQVVLCSQTELTLNKPKAAEWTTEAIAHELRLEDVSAVFTPHYDTSAYPMLAGEKARRSLEEPAYRVFYWVLTGKVTFRPLLTPYDVASLIHTTTDANGAVGSHRKTFNNKKVIGIAYPDKPIEFLTAVPVVYLGEWVTDPAHQFAGDPYREQVFAVARCIVEVENGKFREVTIKWMYVPDQDKFVPVSTLIATLPDPLTMLMRLHDVETR